MPTGCNLQLPSQIVQIDVSCRLQASCHSCVLVSMSSECRHLLCHCGLRHPFVIVADQVQCRCTSPPSQVNPLQMVVSCGGCLYADIVFSVWPLLALHCKLNRIFSCDGCLHTCMASQSPGCSVPTAGSTGPSEEWGGGGLYGGPCRSRTAQSMLCR